MAKIGDHKNLKRVLDTLKPEIKRALPGDCGIDAETFCRQIETAFRQSRDLYECAEGAVQQAVIVAAEVGLELNTKRGHAFLTPRKSKDKTKTYCVYIQGWRGLMHLARQSGLVVGLNAQIIYDGEPYAYQQGSSPRLDHTPAIEASKRVTPVACYAVLFMVKGPPLIEVMPWDDVMDIRRSSGGFLWKDHEGEMARKTPIRRVFKYGPDGLLPDASYRALAVEDNQVYSSTEDRIAAATDATDADLGDALDAAGGGGTDAAENGGERPGTEGLGGEPEAAELAPGRAAPDFSHVDDKTLAAMLTGCRNELKEIQSFDPPGDDAELATCKAKLSALLAEQGRRVEK